MNNDALNELRERQVQAYARGVANGHNSGLLWSKLGASEFEGRFDTRAPIHLFPNTGNETADVAAAHDVGFVDGFFVENPASERVDAEEALAEFHRRVPVDCR